MSHDKSWRCIRRSSACQKLLKTFQSLKSSLATFEPRQPSLHVRSMRDGHLIFVLLAALPPAQPGDVRAYRVHMRLPPSRTLRRLGRADEASTACSNSDRRSRRRSGPSSSLGCCYDVFRDYDGKRCTLDTCFDVVCRTNGFQGAVIGIGSASLRIACTSVSTQIRRRLGRHESQLAKA